MSLGRVALIVNPRSGRGRGDAAGAAAARTLESLGITTRILRTRGPGDATRLAESVTDVDGLLAVGGDGTLNEVLAGRLDALSTPLGVIPMGTANVVAREIGLPLGRPEQAARALAAGATRDVDVALADGRPFLANASCGFDARVIRGLSETRGGRVSMLRYVPLGLKVLAGYRAPRLSVTLDGTALPDTFSTVTVCNVANYGGVFRVTPEADMSDGRLDVCLRRGVGRISVLRHLACALMGWKDRRKAEYHRVRSIRIESATDEPLQVDGEHRGSLPVDIELPGLTARLLVPEGRGQGDDE